MWRIKHQKIVGNLLWNGHLEMFSRPQVIEKSRQYLPLRTDILQKSIVGCPCCIGWTCSFSISWGHTSLTLVSINEYISWSWICEFVLIGFSLTCECGHFQTFGRYVQISWRRANVPPKYPVCLAQPLVLRFSGKRYLYRWEMPNQCHLLSLSWTIR